VTRLVVDENLSPRLAQRLRGDGHDAVHVNEVGLRSAADPVILAWAARAQRTVITGDTDFFGHLRDLGATRPSVVKVVQHGEKGLADVDAQAARLAQVLPDLDRRLGRGTAVTLGRAAPGERPLPLARPERGERPATPTPPERSLPLAPPERHDRPRPAAGRQAEVVLERARARRVNPPQQGRAR